MNVKDIQLQKRKFSTRTGEQVIGEVHLNTSMHDRPKLQFFFYFFCESGAYKGFDLDIYEFTIGHWLS